MSINPDFDPFAHGGSQHDDAAILALFQDWLEASREADKLCEIDEDEESEECNAVLDRRDQIEEEILSISGPSALAIKIYFYLKNELANWAPEAGTLRAPNI
jgi:hypothetical protein